MKRFTAILAMVLLSGMAAFAQVPGPQIPLTGSIGVPGSSAVLGYFPVSFTSDANHTLAPTEWANHVLLVTSTVSLTATRNLIAPNNFGQDLIVQNATTGGQSLQVIASSGAGVAIPNGQSAEVFFDGTNYLFSAGTAAATSLLASTNVWTGANNTFNNGIVTNTATQGISTTNGIVTEMNGITNIYAGTSATSSSGNINSGTLQFLSSFWNGTQTNSHAWLMQDILTSGPTPSANLTITPQVAFGASVPSTVSFLANGQYANLTAATSGVPTNSPCLHFTGAFFTTSSVADDWCIENTPNTSSNHGGLTFTYTGSANGAVQVPNLSTNGILAGTLNVGIGSQGFAVSGSENSINGNVQFTLGTNATSTSGNINSSSPVFHGSYWNGSSVASSNWAITNNLGIGINPTSTLAFSFTGSSGASLVTIPALSVGSTPSPVCTVATGCGSSSVPAATSSALGGVTLASGQTSSALSTVATTGAVTDTTGSMPTSRIPVNIANGVNFWANSIGAGTGPQPIVLNYRQIFTNLFPVGPAPNNRTLAGTYSSDIVNFGALQRATGSASTAPFLMPSYNAPLNIIQSLENDANFTTATNANQITYTQTVDMALLALATAPVDQWNQVTGNSWTCSVAPTDEYYGSIAPGVLLATGQTCSTTITTVAVPGSTVSEPIDVLYSIFASDTGSGTVTVDGSLCTDTITGSSTLANAPFGGATFETSQGFTRTLALARCVPTSVGSHSVLVTSVAGGTNGFGLQAIFTSPLSQNNFTGPTAVKVGVMRQQSDTKSTTTALYNTLSINDCNQMLADGFRCINSPAREPYITLNNLAFMMSSTTATQVGAIDKSGMSWTSGNATLTVPSGVDPSYVGKTAICVDGLTSSTDLFATVQSVPTSTTLLLSIVSPSAAPGTTVSGTGVCHFGYNDTVTLGSISPGLHPTTAGDDALLRGILSVVQPTMVSPNFQTLQTFNGGISANFASNLTPTMLNANAILPNPTQPTFPSVNWQIAPGFTTNTSAGFGLWGDTTTSTVEPFIFSRLNTSVDICDNNVNGSTTNNAFRCGFRFLQATGSAGGLQMPTLSINAAAMTLGGAAIGLSLPVGTATFTPGTGVTSVTCTSGFTCTNTRGDITIVGATAVVGTIATVNFSAALSAAPGMCTVTQNGGATSLGIGHGAASTTSFAITAGVTVGATTVSVDYTCQP